jgi:hypothetical protein
LMLAPPPQSARDAAGAPSSTSEIRPEDELVNFIPMAGSVVKHAGGD